MSITYTKARLCSTIPLAMLATICLAAGVAAAKPDKNQPDYSLTVADGALRVISLEVNRLKSVWPESTVPRVTVDHPEFTDTSPSRTLPASTSTKNHSAVKPAVAPAKSTVHKGALAAGGGEMLYNGIQLPRQWPPRIQQVGNKVLPVPYLIDRPAVALIDVGRQLFVDDFLIEQSSLKRRFHYPERYEGNPVLKPETPTELGAFGEKEKDGNTKPMTAMISDGFCYDSKDKLFKLWYQAGWRDGTMIATSQDGLHWTRLQTDIEPGNNRVLPKQARPLRHGTGISFDPFTTDLSQRYKMLLYEDKKTSAWTSADGIHWQRRAELPNCGDNSTAFYNPFRKKWVISIRVQQGNRNGRARNYREHADFLQAVSWRPLPEKASQILTSSSEEYEWAGTDPLDLPDPEMLARIPKDSDNAEVHKAYGDPPQLYNLDAVAYESILVGMFGILRGPTTGKVWDKLKCVKRNDLNIAYRRDGFYWDRPDRTPFLACSRKGGNWENGYLHCGVGLFTVTPDQLWFYYSGWSGVGPKGPSTYAGGSTGVAFLRRDGFASMDAGESGGTLVTRPLRFSGKHLFVNVAAPKGELRVEAIDLSAVHILATSRPLTADGTKQRVEWLDGADLAQLAGQTVRFRFHLTSGQLYSFWVTPDPAGASNGYLGAGGAAYQGLRDGWSRSGPDSR